MKKIYLICFAVLIAARVLGQNAFYDAQDLANITPKQKAVLSAPIDQSQLSDEETKTIAALKIFLDHPFSPGVDRQLLNGVFIKKLFKKLAIIDPNNSASLRTAYSSVQAFADLPGATSLTLGGLQSDISHMSSADYQTMLIDATAKYLAESFKEDVTYHYFRLLKDKIDSIPMIKDLLPKTCAAVEKIDPFNFKNLGDSWKAAFEQDLQNLPVSLRDFISKNQTRFAWCQKVYNSSYFRYYSYSTDILEPLIKGAHPLEILQTLDKNYYKGPNVSDPDYYKGFIHFLNILQSNLQDSTKKSSTKQFENVWISFNQLKQLNTDLKLSYFCGLIYLQDPDFFDHDSFGKELNLVLGAAADKQRKFIEALPNLLILLNQVEGGFTQIKSLRTGNSSPAPIAATYLKEVLSITDSTNHFLISVAKFTGNDNLKNITDKITLCLTYGNDAYQIYTDVVQKNYGGALQQAVTLLETIDKKDAVNIQLITEVLNTTLSGNFTPLFTNFTAANAALGPNPLDAAAFNQLLFQNVKFNMVDSDGFALDLKAKVKYTTLSADAKKAIDTYLNGGAAQIVTLNKLLLKDPKVIESGTYLKVLALLNKYGNVIAGVATAQNSADLEAVIKKYVASSGTYVIQRTSLSTISVAAKVGATGGFEGTDHFKSFQPNFGLTVPIGVEFTWGGRSDKKTNYPFLTKDNKVKYLNETSQSLFLQVFDIAAVVNYRLGADSSSTLPQKILLKQVFSPGVSYNFSLKNSPFDIGFGLEYTPELRKIGDNLQASTIRLFVRIAWDKPLIFLTSKRQTKNGFDIGTPN
jgi:hypothetical protein